MRLTELLSAEQIHVRHGPPKGPVIDKIAAIHILAGMLATAGHVDSSVIERVLCEREQLQSTGIGEGVAIPHGALVELETQHACLLVVPEGVEFAAIDGQRVTIFFAVIGPKRATGEHLKTLARVSRVLRNRAFRDRLVAASGPDEGYALIAAEENERR
ncbi:MAG: PTS sugar transporter subunit IIA [Polyangiaceae bacterium]|jgi:PTS system nitrogen regulatory IIA component